MDNRAPTRRYGRRPDGQRGHLHRTRMVFLRTWRPVACPALLGGVVRVLAGQRVEVFAGVVGDEFRVAADLDEPRGVAGVDDEQADLAVIEHVAAFLPLQGRVHLAHSGLRISMRSANARYSARTVDQSAAPRTWING